MNSHNSQKVGSNRGRCEGIYNRTGEPSVTFCEKEQQRECALVFYKKSEQAMHSLLRRGGEGETRTPAPVTRPTPLAGAPRHQLEYFSMVT